MAMWILVSGLFPIFLIGMLVKAFLHFRRLRSALEKIPEQPILTPTLTTTPAWTPTDDWVPTP